MPEFFKVEIEQDEFAKYILWIVDSMIQANSALRFGHIMIPELPEEKKYSLLKLVYQYFLLKHVKSLNTRHLQSFLNYINKRIRKGIQDQEGLKGTSRRFKKLLEEQKGRRQLKVFLEELINYASIEQESHKVNTTLINVLGKHKDLVFEDTPDYHFLYQELESFNYPAENVYPLVIFNSSKDLRGVDVRTKNIYLLEQLSNVILYGVEKRSSSRSFKYRAIQKLNDDEGTSIENVLLISFIKRYNLSRALNKMKRVQSDFYSNSTDSHYQFYAIHPFEKREATNNDSLDVQLISSQSAIYDVFISIVSSYDDLNELLSLRVRNIYSLCFSKELKDYIIGLIFSSSSRFLHEETILAISSLSSNEKNKIRETLEMLLDSFLISEYNSHILKRCDFYKNILLSVDALNDEYFSNLIKAALQTDKPLITWNSITSSKNQSVLILDYRDTGGYPFRITPNIHEFPLNAYPDSSAVYRDDLFGRNYTYTYTEYWETTLKYLFKNPIRYDAFDIDSLIKELSKLKLDKRQSTGLFDLDNTYNKEFESKYYRVQIEKSKPKKYVQSDQFLVGNSNDFSVMRVDELFEEYESLNGVDIQLLESIYSGLNLFETTQTEKDEIIALKQRYNLSQDNIENRLWKVVLKRKVELEGIEHVYQKLKTACEDKGGRIVSIAHFEDSWMNPHSSSVIPRSKAAFLAMIEFLELPLAYYSVMIKQRAKKRLESRRSSSKMNSLIIDLVENGLFSGQELNMDLVDSFAKRHHFDEIGIPASNQYEELMALVELLKDNIKVRPLINIVEE